MYISAAKIWQSLTNDSQINSDVYHLFLDSLFDWTVKEIKNNHFIFKINTTHLIKHAKWWRCGILLFERFIIAYCYCFTYHFSPTLGNVYAVIVAFSVFLSQVVQIFSAVSCILCTFSYTCLTFSCSASLTAPIWCGLFVSAQINLCGNQIWQSEKSEQSNYQYDMLE